MCHHQGPSQTAFTQTRIVKSVDFPDLKTSARIRKTNLRQVSRAFCKHERRQKRDRLGRRRRVDDIYTFPSFAAGGAPAKHQVAPARKVGARSTI
jgi:hypothetical protein